MSNFITMQSENLRKNNLNRDSMVFSLVDPLSNTQRLLTTMLSSQEFDYRIKSLKKTACACAWVLMSTGRLLMKGCVHWRPKNSKLNRRNCSVQFLSLADVASVFEPKIGILFKSDFQRASIDYLADPEYFRHTRIDDIHGLMSICIIIARH